MLEDGAVFLAQAGAVGHLTVGERSVVGPQSGLMRDVPPHTHVIGGPAREFGIQQKVFAALPRLPELMRRVRKLEQRLRGAGDATEE